MGWAYGIDENGREVGYGVTAVCDQDGCDAVIDRGLAYRCGAIGEDEGCGFHFCGEHLFYVLDKRDDKPHGPLCAVCVEAWEEEAA